MGVETAVIIASAAAAASAAGSAYSGYQQKRSGDRQASAAKRQLEEAKKTAQQEEQARNKANQKQADTEGLLEANTDDGIGSTTLTGTRGDPFNPNSIIGGGSKLLGD